MLVRITYLGTLLLKKIICRRYVDAPRKKKQGRAARNAADAYAMNFLKGSEEIKEKSQQPIRFPIQPKP